VERISMMTPDREGELKWELPPNTFSPPYRSIQ